MATGDKTLWQSAKKHFSELSATVAGTKPEFAFVTKGAAKAAGAITDVYIQRCIDEARGRELQDNLLQATCTVIKAYQAAWGEAAAACLSAVSADLDEALRDIVSERVMQFPECVCVRRDGAESS
jgi:hypothetical protein